MRYSEHEKLVDPARERSEVWRTIAGLLLAAIITMTIGFLLLSGLSLVTSDVWYYAFMAEMETVSTPRSTIWTLLGFIQLTVAIALVLRVLHDRPFVSIIGPLQKTIRDFIRVGGAVIVLFLLMSLLPAGSDRVLLDNVEFSRWIILLPIALLAVLVQVSAEEFLFRGYLQSQFAARFSNPLVWLFAPTALFAILHYSPPTQGDNAWLIVLWAGMFGLIAADLTARSGNLGPAIALHLANNAWAILIAAPMGPLSGISLYTFDFDLTDTEAVRAALPLDFAMMIVGWLAARVAIRA